MFCPSTCPNRRSSANKARENLLSLRSCKSALGSDGLKIARRLLLVLCCAAAASGDATAPHTTLRKARRLMSAPSLDQDILLAKTGILEEASADPSATGRCPCGVKRKSRDSSVSSPLIA